MPQLLQNFIVNSTALASGAALFLIIRFPNRIVFALAIILWFAILILVENRLKRHKEMAQSILPILLATAIAFVSLSGVIEWKFLDWPFILLLVLVIWILFQSIIIRDKSLLRVEQKPYQRIMVLVWSFDAYALSAALFAVSLFFPDIPFYALAIIGGAVFGLIGFMIWRMYFHLDSRRGLAWIFLVSFLLIELIWVFHLLPFGYLISGFFVTWIWYILQLLVRFHFSPKDVMWKKQIWFLACNVILCLALMIFFVRWV